MDELLISTNDEFGTVFVILLEVKIEKNSL